MIFIQLRQVMLKFFIKQWKNRVTLIKTHTLITTNTVKYDLCEQRASPPFIFVVQFVHVYTRALYMTLSLYVYTYTRDKYCVIGDLNRCL